MSGETWRLEFYPTRAFDTPSSEAVDHSILKWTGLLKENMDKHGVQVEGNTIYDIEDLKDVIHLGSSTCALCEVWYEQRGKSCASCPIVKATGLSCDHRIVFGDVSSPWFQWTQGRNPQPMIDVLMKAKAWEDQRDTLEVKLEKLGF